LKEIELLWVDIMGWVTYNCGRHDKMIIISNFNIDRNNNFFKEVYSNILNNNGTLGFIYCLQIWDVEYNTINKKFSHGEFMI